MEGEVNVLRSKYAQLIDDGRKIEAFTNLGEWQWYVDKVLQPTITEYTNRLLEGKFTTDREDWAMRGMINGLKMVIESTQGFKQNAEDAKRKAEKLEKDIKAAENE